MKKPRRSPKPESLIARRFGILNDLGHIWTPETFEDEAGGRRYLEQRSRENPSWKLDGHKIVRVRVTVRLLSPAGEDETMSDIDPRMFFMPIDKATVPPAGMIQHFKDHWWIVHPEKGLAFWDKRHKSPQCNSNESIARHIAQAHPWAEVRFFPSVFRSINISDYAD